MTEPAHAVYAPSSAHRWMICTASATAIAQAGQLDSALGEDEREEGTQAHEEIERCLGPLCETRRCPKTGWQLEAFPVNPDHAAAYGVALVLDYVRQLPPGRLWIEQRVRLTNEIWGRCDVAHFDDATGVLTIVDYKNGYVDVDAAENEQLRIYGAGTIYTHQLAAKWIRYVVVQPNSFLPVPRVKQWVESAESLFEFAKRAAAVPHGPLEFKAGEQCTYCPMFGRCPASRDILVQLGAVMAYAPDQVPADKVALFLTMQKPVKDWFENVNRAQLKAALSGNVPAGMKLVTGVKHREWVDPNAARAAVVAKHGVDALDPPTPAQAEKLGGIDVEKLSRKPEGGPVLALENDKRPPFKQKSAAEMFAGALQPQGV
jgi:hypothetical protein